MSDASWILLQERVLRHPQETDANPNSRLELQDVRLQQPPFSNHHVQYIVFRHSLRASIAFKNAVKVCTENRQRLFTTLALDSCKSGKEYAFNEQALEQATCFFPFFLLQMRPRALENIIMFIYPSKILLNSHPWLGGYVVHLLSPSRFHTTLFSRFLRCCVYYQSFKYS